MIKNGAPGRSRTRNLQIRSLTLYPIELRAPNNYIIHNLKKIATTFFHINQIFFIYFLHTTNHMNYIEPKYFVIEKKHQIMADGEGFEPSNGLPHCRFSRPVPSTTRPPIQHSYSTTFCDESKYIIFENMKFFISRKRLISGE